MTQSEISSLAKPGAGNWQGILWFPGQGSQAVGMGESLCIHFPEARLVFEEASDSLGYDLRKLCREGGENGTQLNQTEFTQPALLATSVAAWRAVRATTGFQPTLVAGHSLGEYSALVAAEALPLSIAARWVQKRGQAMQAAVPVGVGGMAAIMGLEDEAIRTLCDTASERDAKQPEQFTSLVSPANFNAPGQVVISGHLTAIKKVGELLATPNAPYSGGKKIDLPVSAPFHSPLMRPARDQMNVVFADHSGVLPNPTPYVANVHARIVPTLSDPKTLLSNLLNQIEAPVLWTQTVHTCLAELPGTTILELGPGKVLAGLYKRISKQINSAPRLTSEHLAKRMFSVGDLESLREFEKGMVNP